MSRKPLLAPTESGSWGGQLCECGVCGYRAVCTPADDFYVRSGEDFFRCETCVCCDLGRGAGMAP